MAFKDYCSHGKCDVCGKEDEVLVCSSSMGAVSFAYCEDCFNKRLEPYGAMVACISMAGHFPKDINETYQKHCRHIINELNISEEQFIEDVDKAIEDFDEDFREFCENHHQENAPDPEWM